METFATVQKNAENMVITAIDSSTPVNHFIASARILGLSTVYLFEGLEGDDNAVIKGRIEFPGGNSYKGDGLKGGTYLGAAQSFDESFEKMV